MYRCTCVPTVLQDGYDEASVLTKGYKRIQNQMNSVEFQGYFKWVEERWRLHNLKVCVLVVCHATSVVGLWAHVVQRSIGHLGFSTPDLECMTWERWISYEVCIHCTQNACNWKCSNLLKFPKLTQQMLKNQECQSCIKALPRIHSRSCVAAVERFHGQAQRNHKPRSNQPVPSLKRNVCIFRWGNVMARRNLASCRAKTTSLKDESMEEAQTEKPRKDVSPVMKLSENIRKRRSVEMGRLWTVWE